ncbi:GNAT family N-acetyltransferase [Streptomyces sp. NPDC005374]|uniref:GNAT family N-acetyltransferase n=1 Tax=Streptomyces sp. NPDC005374 TaxID=3364713 RepID=UPI0036AFCEB4
MNRALPVVRLRVPTDEDAVAWHRLFDDPDVMEFHGGRSAELSVHQELTARQRRHDADAGAQPWPRDRGPTGEIEIGWRLGREYWGKGYATAAAQMTPERVRAAGVPDVVAMVRAGNTRSISVTERPGMRLAEVFTPGGARDGHCYRLDPRGSHAR